MAPPITGHAVGRRLADALGLGGRQVREITLCVPVDGLVECRFVEYLTADRAATAESVLFPSEGEFDAAVREVQRLGSQGFRPHQLGPPAPSEGLLSLDGPAERLARAVLAGNVRLALELADMVQDLWRQAQEPAGADAP